MILVHYLDSIHIPQMYLTEIVTSGNLTATRGKANTVNLLTPLLKNLPRSCKLMYSDYSYSTLLP